MNTEQREKIREQAKILAIQSIKSEPDIEKIYWFPDDSEVRLIEIDEKTVNSLSGRVQVFYFDPAPEENITVPSGIGIIRPDEFGKLDLPEDWGDWQDGEELDIRQ
jgi:hypothetical protein